MFLSPSLMKSRLYTVLLPGHYLVFVGIYQNVPLKLEKSLILNYILQLMNATCSGVQTDPFTVCYKC